MVYIEILFNLIFFLLGGGGGGVHPGAGDFVGCLTKTKMSMSLLFLSKK